MAIYYQNRPRPVRVSATSTSKDNHDTSAEVRTLSEYDKHRLQLLSNDTEEGWASELRRYLGKVQDDVEKDTDIVEWWQVSYL